MLKKNIPYVRYKAFPPNSKAIIASNWVNFLSTIARLKQWNMVIKLNEFFHPDNPYCSTDKSREEKKNSRKTGWNSLSVRDGFSCWFYTPSHGAFYDRQRDLESVVLNVLYYYLRDNKMQILFQTSGEECSRETTLPWHLRTPGEGR